MRRSSGSLTWRVLALVLVGGAGLMLALPRGQGSLNRVEPVAAAPTARTAALVTPAAPAPQPAAVNTAAPAPAAPIVTPTAAIATTAAAASSSDAPRVIQAALELPPAADPSTATATPPDTAPRTDGRIGSSDVNARSGPSATSGRLFVIPAGEAVTLGASNGGWVHVYRQGGQDGWIYRRLLAGAAIPPGTAPAGPGTSPPRSAATARPTPRQLIGHFGQVRTSIAALEAPVNDAPSAFVLEPGDRFRITQAHGSWLLVETDDGYSGWIPG